MKKVILTLGLIIITQCGWSQQLSLSQQRLIARPVISEFSDDVGFRKVVSYSHHSSQDSAIYKPRNPAMALLLSGLIPGAGQFYNHQYGKGGIMLGGYLTSVLVVNFVSQRFNNEFPITGILIFLSIHLWSMIDAPIVANKLNRENRLTINVTPSLHLQTNYLTRKSELSFGPKITFSF